MNLIKLVVIIFVSIIMVILAIGSQGTGKLMEFIFQSPVIILTAFGLYNTFK